MIWRLHSRPLACALALGALLLAGCGADEESGIPADQAAELEDALGKVEQDFDKDLCDELPASIEDLQGQVEALPETIDPELRTVLSDGVTRLTRLGDKDCEPPEPEPTTETAPPPTTAPTQPTEPPTTEETEPETETETETETEEVKPPEDGDDGGSSGQGSGGDSGSLPPDDDEGGDS